MKLKKFKEKNRKKTGVIIFTFVCILLVSGVIFYRTFAIFEVQTHQNVIKGTVQDPGDIYFAIYVNNKLQKDIPTPTENYMLDTSQTYCGTLGQKDNNIKITYENGQITILNVTNARTKCNLYFKDFNDYDICKEKYGEESVQCKIVAQYVQNKPKNLCPTVSDNNITKNTNETENEIVCKAPDNYGDSYYFRGTNTNNYVKFAGFYWRIIRINGNGSIRIIYAGDANTIDNLPNKEEVLKNGFDDKDTGYTRIQTAAFNTLSNDNAYVGYMYGTPNSETYEETHKNINDSNIKTILENWYKENIKNKGFNYYVDDNIFCNLRETETGSGIKNETTSYKGKNRATLICSNTNDSFTVMDNENGNAMLTFPIGLITIDEAHVAGSLGTAENTKYYLYTGYAYWTLTPWGKEESTNYVRVFAVSSNGKTWYNNNPNQSWVGVRPVINLTKDALQLGTGTWDDPYRLSN